MSIILFDFDFTLGDSSKGILECFRYALESSGLPVPEDRAILSTVGMSLRDALSILAPGGSYDELRQAFVARGDEVMVPSAIVYGEVPAVLSALRSRGYKTGIVTSKFRRRIEAILKRDGLEHLFDVVVGSEDVPNHKPNPDGIERAIRLLGGDKQSTTYVGDAVVDLEAARAAGVRFMGVSTGPTPAEELAAHGVPVARGLKELLDLFPQVAGTRNAARHEEVTL